MSISSEFIVAGATAIGSVFTAMYLNRRKINEIQSWAWGRERDETDEGVAGQTRSLDEKINSIEVKLDAEFEERRGDHAEVEREVRRNRTYFSDSIENLATTLNQQLPEAEIDVDDYVEPDWKDHDYHTRDRYRRDEYSTDD